MTPKISHEKRPETPASTVSRAKRVKAAAPDLAERVRSGHMALDRAERAIRDRQAEQRHVTGCRQQRRQEPRQAVQFAEHPGQGQGVSVTITDRMAAWRRVSRAAWRLERVRPEYATTASPRTADQRFSLPIAGFQRTPVGP
jgi:hypothetical protein